MNVTGISSSSAMYATPSDSPITLPTGNGPYAPPPDGFDPPSGDKHDLGLMFASRGKGGGKNETTCPEGTHPEVTIKDRTVTTICVDDPKTSSGGKTSPGGAPILE